MSIPPIWQPENCEHNCPHCGADPGTAHADFCPFTAAARAQVPQPEYTGPDPYLEGSEARRWGVPLARCPYAPGSGEHAEWVGGWLDHDVPTKKPALLQRWNIAAVAMVGVALWQFVRVVWFHDRDPWMSAFAWGAVALMSAARVSTRSEP